MFLYRIVLISKAGSEIKGSWNPEKPSEENIQKDVALYRAAGYRLETSEVAETPVLLYTFYSENSETQEKIVSRKKLNEAELNQLKKRFNLDLFAIESISLF